MQIHVYIYKELPALRRSSSLLGYLLWKNYREKCCKFIMSKYDLFVTNCQNTICKFLALMGSDLDSLAVKARADKSHKLRLYDYIQTLCTWLTALQ